MRLLDWLSDARADRGIDFALDHGGWEHWDYQRLATAAHSAAEQLLEGGVLRHDIVAIAIPTGPGFLAAFFGALLAGATPAPLLPPRLFENQEAYHRRTVALLRAGPALVATDQSLADPVERARKAAGLSKPAVAISPARTPATEVHRPRADLALVQFTSGSTGQPRGIQVGYENLAANLAMIFDWVGPSHREVWAHWLPLYHDMGLIGVTLVPVTRQFNLRVLRPEQFVAQPGRWLNCFGREGAALTASPTFGYAYAASRVTPEELEGSDFSNLRVACIGAERVDPGALRRFIALLGPHGFRPRAFAPAYGLAEATLGVTVVRPGRPLRAVRPRWGELAFGAPVQIAERAELEDERVGDGAGWLVSCGTPMLGATVKVVDHDGHELPEGSLGEIRVTGPAVARGWLGPPSVVTRLADRALDTGDAGFFYDGQLFVLGRLGDAIKVRGRTLYAEELEARLAAIPEVPLGRCVVLGGGDARVSVAAVVEREPGDWVADAATELRRQVGADAHVRILCGESGTIMRTTSGKPRRRAMWEALVEGDLPVTTAYDSAARPPRVKRLAEFSGVPAQELTAEFERRTAGLEPGRVEVVREALRVAEQSVNAFAPRSPIGELVAIADAVADGDPPDPEERLPVRVRRAVAARTLSRLADLDLYIDPYGVEPVWPHAGMLILNPYLGCSFGCVYCFRAEEQHESTDWFLKGQPIRVQDDEVVIDRLLDHPLFVADRSRVGLHTATTDPFLPQVRDSTFAMLEELERRGLANDVMIITKFFLRREDVERLSSFRRFRILLMLTYNAAPEAVETMGASPQFHRHRLEMLDHLREHGQELSWCHYYRPIVSGWNDSDEQIADALRFGEHAGLSVLGGLKPIEGLTEYAQARGLPAPRLTDERDGKVFPDELVERILAVHRRLGLTSTLVADQSCGLTVMLTRATGSVVPNIEALKMFDQARPDRHPRCFGRCTPEQLSACGAPSQPSAQTVQRALHDLHIEAAFEIRDTGVYLDASPDEVSGATVETLVGLLGYAVFVGEPAV